MCSRKKAAMALLNDRRVRLVMVNVDKIMSSDPDLASGLMDSFDLSSLPFILQTDASGIIQRRYLSLVF